MTFFFQINRKVPSERVQKPDCCACGDAGIFTTGPEDWESQAWRNQIAFQKKKIIGNIMFTHLCVNKMNNF